MVGGMGARATAAQAAKPPKAREKRRAELTQALALPDLSDEARVRLEVALAVQEGQTGYKAGMERGLGHNVGGAWAKRYEEGGIPALLGKHTLPSPEQALWRQELIQALATSHLTIVERTRLQAVHDVIVAGKRHGEVTGRPGCSHKSASTWLATYRAGGPQALLGRPIASEAQLQLIQAVDGVIGEPAQAAELKARLLALQDAWERERRASGHFLTPPVPLDTHTTGALGETLMRAYLLARGIQAEFAAGHSAYDLVIDTHTGEPPFRVQVKAVSGPESAHTSAKRGSRTSSYDFNLTPGQRTTSGYDPKDIDIHACVALDGPHVGFLSADEVGTNAKFRQPGVAYQDNACLRREFADYPLERAMELVRVKWRKALSSGS
jgi:hypothetical protein